MPSPPQAVEKLVQGAESGCPSEKEKQIILNCARLLTRTLPYIFEDPDWRGFFWSTVPGAGRDGVSRREAGLISGCSHCPVSPPKAQPGRGAFCVEVVSPSGRNWSDYFKETVAGLSAVDARLIRSWVADHRKCIRVVRSF